MAQDWLTPLPSTAWRLPRPSHAPVPVSTKPSRRARPDPRASRRGGRPPMNTNGARAGICRRSPVKLFSRFRSIRAPKPLGLDDRPLVIGMPR
jgi:hypothetical protein